MCRGFLLIVPTDQFFTCRMLLVACCEQVLSDTREFPAYSQIYLRNYNGLSYSYGRHSLGLEFSASPCG